MDSRCRGNDERREVAMTDLFDNYSLFCRNHKSNKRMDSATALRCAPNDSQVVLVARRMTEYSTLPYRNAAIK